MGINWEQVCEQSKRRLRGSAIRDLLAITTQPDIISFAGGLPAPELFPVAAVRESFDRVLRDHGADALQYGPTEGFLPLREWLAERLSARGMRATPDEILITSGSQQALDLLGIVLLQRGSTALVEAPSYVGALQAFALREPGYLPVPMDDDGMIVSEASGLLEARAGRVELIYTVATFQNPSGVTMSLARRQALLEVSDRFGVPLIEDDPYGDLRYDGTPVPAFRALAGGADAAYLGTFSKILAPGLRLGYIVAPQPLIRRLVLAKQGTDLHTDNLAQQAVHDFVRHNDIDQHIVRIRDVYRMRRDTMLAAMERYFPPSCAWTRPAGGLFTWVTLPESVNAAALLREAVGQKVAFVPGVGFFTDGSGTNTMRLNFSHAGPERIEEGIKRLGEAIAEHLALAQAHRVAALV